MEHWHGFELLQSYSGITLFSRFPLPLTNSRAANLLEKCGCSAAEYAPELTADEANELRSRTQIQVLHREDKIPLLVTRIPLKPGSWTDRDGNMFTVTRENAISQLFAD